MGGTLSLLLLASAAMAADTLVVSVGIQPGDTATPLLVEDAVRKAGMRDFTMLPAEELDGLVNVIAVSLRVEDANCGGAVALDSWRQKLDVADDAIQRLRIEEALSAISDADLSTGCLDRVAERRELQRLHLLNARANLLASQQFPAQADFYRSQAGYAVQAMHGLGDDLLLPQGLEPELVDFVRSIERRADHPVIVAGVGPGGAVYMDGQRLSKTPVARPGGTHLLQVENGGAVTGASMPPLLAGPNLVFAGFYSPGDLEMGAWDVGFDALASETLQAVSALIGSPIVVAAFRDGAVTLRTPDGKLIEGRRGPAPLPDVDAIVAELDGPEQPRGYQAAAGDWEHNVGAGLSLGTASYVGGPVDLAGPSGGLSVWYRRTVSDYLLVAASVDLVARSSQLPVGYDDQTLWRAHVPVRLGLHAGQPSRGFGWDAGVDLALVTLGSFDDAWRFRFGALPTAGIVVEVLNELALRVDAYGGGGFGGWWSAGGRVGFERAW